MKRFGKKVDRRSRSAMISFLSEHYRYNTMNSWNGSTSYAHNMKIYNLGLESDLTNKLYELIETNEFHWQLECLIQEFTEAHNYEWQAGFNGRSDGYLVLFQGDAKHTFPGKSTDQYEDFEDWDMGSLRWRADLICEFDALADALVAEAIYMAKNYNVVEETYHVPQTRKVLVAV